MYIKSIELINVRSFKEVKITLEKGINLLLGKNNSGKSTIIRAAYSLQSGSIKNNLDIRKTCEYARLYIEINDISGQDKSLFVSKDKKTKVPVSANQMIYFGLYKEKTEAFFYDSKRKTGRDKRHRVTFDQGNDQENLTDFHTFPDKENENNFIYPYLAKRKTDYYEGQSGKEDTYRVAENFRNLAAKIQKIGNSSHPRNDEFVKLCTEILGFKIGTIAGDGNSNIDTGIFIKDGEIIPLKSMGEGVANILGLITILLTEDNKLFLIEELENDIHPEALKKLLDLIIDKSNSNQFIISTHSHIVLKYLGAVPDSKIFYLNWTPNDEQAEVYKNVPVSEIKELENTPKNKLDILSQLGYEFWDFDLYEAYLILEESSAERIIRDFLIPNFTPKLYNKLKTIAAKGVDDLKVRVHDFNRLFVFIHTNPIYYRKAWVIADGDMAGTDCISNLKLTFKNWPQEHFLNFNRENFELYYPSEFQNECKTALAITDKKEKMVAKKNLLEKVMHWTFENRDEAISKFEQSAEEVINILKELERKIIRGE